jgi:hypothetical protein
MAGIAGASTKDQRDPDEHTLLAFFYPFLGQASQGDKFAATMLYLKSGAVVRYALILSIIGNVFRHQ